MTALNSNSSSESIEDRGRTNALDGQPHCSAATLESVRDSDRNLWAVLKSAEETRADHIRFRAVGQPTVSRIYVYSAAYLVSKCSHCAKGSFGSKVSATNQAVPPNLHSARPGPPDPRSAPAEREA